MPTTPHIESHFPATEIVRNIVIDMSDGPTVPFALAAGISGAGAATNIIVTAGLAGISPMRSGAQTVLVGGLAAGVAFGLARIIR